MVNQSLRNKNPNKDYYIMAPMPTAKVPCFQAFPRESVADKDKETVSG